MCFFFLCWIQIVTTKALRHLCKCSQCQGRETEVAHNKFQDFKVFRGFEVEVSQQDLADCQADCCNIQGDFPVLLRCGRFNAIKLTFSWFFLRWMSSSFRVSISLSRFKRLRLVSSMTFLRPTMSASTDWRMASSDSYLNRMGQSR